MFWERGLDTVIREIVGKVSVSVASGRNKYEKELDEGVLEEGVVIVNVGEGVFEEYLRGWCG